jgi:acetylornithine deacetylase/succinyl-diaminopimelate desuccinylase-like protein
MMRVVVSGLFLIASSLAAPQFDPAVLQGEAVGWLQGYLRVNTINPPGNEIAGAQFLAAILKKEGIPFEIAESAPGRANIWVRLKGGDKPALMLLHHMDVVPADRRFWSTDPLSGELRDGQIYGRGALDTKSTGILHLATIVALHRARATLNRDVIFLATADEEAGGEFGVGWLVKNRADLFKNVGYVINEGGGGELNEGRVQFGVEVTQKVPYWFRVTAKGEPSHGSRPRETSSVMNLIAALERLRTYSFEPRISPAVDAYFKAISATAPVKWQTRFANIDSAIRTKGVALELQRDLPAMHALIRNTCSMTRLSASDKINTVPTEAWAELDCRLLPDQNPAAFTSELQAVLGPGVEISKLMGFAPAVSSADTELFRIIQDVSRQHFPGAPVVPAVQTGFTDSHFLRDLGITAYGYAPIVVPLEDAAGLHGNNERISAENVRRGVTMMQDIVRRLATTPK